MDSAAPERSLAYANLLRVRGQCEEAKRTLLALLADRPDDADALNLLARTCEDAGEIEEARRWRGLAGAASSAHEEIDAAEGRHVPRLAVPSVLLLGILVIGLGFAIGRSSARHESLQILEGRVEAPGLPEATGRPADPPKIETAGTTIAATNPIPTTERLGETRAEASGLARLTAAGTVGSILAVAHDPRTDTVTVTFAPRDGEVPRREAALIARAAFATFTTAKTLQLRALRVRELVFLATSQRDRLATVEAEGWARENEANPDALAAALLSDEWSPPAADATNAP